MTGPFSDLFSSGGGKSPFADLFTEPTQTGINAAQTQNISDNITQLTALRAKSPNPADQARIDRVIASLKQQQSKVGYAEPPSGPPLSIFARGLAGAAAGVAKAPVELGELAASIPAATGQTAADESVYKDLRTSLSERAAKITATVQPPGLAAATGEFGGEVPGQMLAFGPVGEGVGAVGRFTPFADLFEKNIAGGLVKRVAVGAGRAAAEVSPITAIGAAANRHDAIQEAQVAFDNGQLTQEGLDQIKKASSLEAIKNFVVGEVGAAAFGAFAPPGEKTVAGTKVPGEPGAAPSAVELVQREAELAAINAKAKADATAKAERAQTKKLAKAQWTLENPDAEWNDLETEDQAKYISDFRDKIKAATARAAQPAAPSASPVGLDLQGQPQTAAELAATVPPNHALTDHLPDDLFLATNKYVVGGTQADAETAARLFAERPEGQAFQAELKKQYGDEFTVYRAGDLIPGQLQSYTTDPTKLAFFKNLHNTEAISYRVKASDVAFPGSDSLHELVIRSAGNAPTVPPRSPKLDKGGEGLSPTVRNLIQRQGLKNAYREANLDFDEGLSNKDLQDKLAAQIKDQGTKVSADAQAADVEAANRETFAKMMAYTDVGKRLGIKEDVASMHAQGKTNNEILAVIDSKLPSYLTPAQKIEVIQAIRTDDLPAIDTSYEGLTGEKPIAVADFKAPAVRDSKTGRVFEGAIHADAIAAGEKAGIKLPSKESWENGYSTNDGRFVGRDEAEAIANKEDATLEHGPVNVPSGQGREVLPDRTISPRESPSPSSNPREGSRPSPGTELSPTASPAVAVVAPKRTFLLGVKTDMPIEAMTVGQLDDMKDVVADGHVEAVKAGDTQHAKQLLNDLDLLGKETQRREAASKSAASSDLPRPFKQLSPEALLTNREALEGKIEELLAHSKTAEGPERDQIRLDLAEAKTRLTDIKSEIGTRKIEARETQKEVRSRPAAPKSSGPPPLKASDFKKPPSTLSDGMLDRQINDIHSRLDVLDPRESGPYQERLANLYDEKAKRESVKEGPVPPADPVGLAAFAKDLHQQVNDKVGAKLLIGKENNPSYSGVAEGIWDSATPEQRLAMLDKIGYAGTPEKRATVWKQQYHELEYSKLAEAMPKLNLAQINKGILGEGPGGMPPLKPGDGFKVQFHPAVGAFGVGFGYGLIPTDQNKDLTDEEYLSRAFMWGLGSAGLFMGAKYLAARLKTIETPKNGTTILDKKIVYSVDDLKTGKIPTATRLREWYRGLARSTDAIEAIPGVRGLPAERNPGKLAAYYGRYAAQAEHWLTTGPVRVDENGMVQHMDGLSFQAIQKLAGNKAGLDELVVALSSAELAGKLGENRVPMNVMEREKVIRSAPQNLMDAAKALRQYHANLLQTQFDAGLVSAEGLAKMLSENYYTPMQRVMEQVDAIRKANPLFKGQPTAIEARAGGSNIKVKSPSDVTVEMTARMLRAAEYGQMQKALVDHVNSLPQVVKNEIIIPANRSLSNKAADYEAIAEDLRKTLSISQADARGMVSYLDHDSIHELPTIRDNKGFEWGIINHYDNGVIQTLKVRPDVFKALKTMTQPEKDWFWSFIAAPTRLATKGVVLDPTFAVRRGFIESYLGYLGSEYGFRPGLDQMAGWWDVFSRSQRYRDMQAVGGTGNIGSLQFKDVAKFGGSNAAMEAFSLAKEMKPVQAMRVLMEPFLQAARAGENLAALRHGASTIEAAYAANNLLGNVRMQGYFEGMRRFNTLSMFARPTISHVDKLLEKSGLHPFRTPEYNKTAFGQWSKDAGMPARVSSGLTFATKGFASLALPSAALWYLNKDDDEINELRQTTVGSHYWFFRNPFVSKESSGSIIRLPKPQVIGQIFGTSIEAHLDNQYKQDPDGTSRMLSGIYDEAALNVLPQIGVIPMSLWANKDYRFGTPIVPGRDSEADPSYQGFTNASIPSRIISDKLSSISGDVNNETLRTALSPAGIDYVLNTFAGMMGQDALKAVNSALLYHKDGFLPAREELPIVSRFLARYPSMNTYEVQKFYERDKKVQAASQTVAKLVKDRPDALGDYYSQNMNRIQLASIHQEVRQKIADMRRALEDVRNAPAGTYDQQGKEAIQKQFVSIIIQEAKVANDIAKNMSNK